MVSRVSIQNILSTVYQKALHAPWGRTTSVALLILGAGGTIGLIFRSQIQKCLFSPHYDDLPALVTALKARAATAHRSISNLSAPFRIGNARGDFKAVAIDKTTNLNMIADQAFLDSASAMVVNTIPATDALENYLPGSTLDPTPASKIILPPEKLDQYCVKYSIRESDRPIYHLHAPWDLNALTDGVVGVIQEAARAINAGKTVLFHYKPGSDSSVGFLAFVLLACKKETLRTATDTDRRREILATLNDIADQGRLLYPSVTLLKLLLDPASFRKVIAPLQTAALANRLAAAAANGQIEESFDPFTFGTSKGGYIVNGLGSNEADPAALETHVRGIMDSQANFVVNLMQPTERKNYLALLTPQPSSLASTKLYKFENEKRLYNFIDWQEGEWVNEGKEEALLHLVKMIAALVSSGKTVFVHCQRGSQRAAMFVALVELFQKRRTIDLSEENLHHELSKILLKFTKFKESRPPRKEQLERLTNYEFLKKLVS
jgi:hypothetical protein